ncbi:MAG: hypothetical protein ACTSSO_06315 [Candidatus Hodarchaeales archaeon]
MKINKLLSVIILIAIITTFTSVNGSEQELDIGMKVSSVQWGWTAHHKIAEEALNYIEDDWMPVWDSMVSLVKGGSILPDTWHNLGDTPNHLYYPDDPNAYTGDDAVLNWYNWYANNLTIGEYSDAILSASIMGHYWSDLNIPVHTDDYWDGHSEYESDINKDISEFTIGAISIDETIDDVRQYAVDAATHAHQYYDEIRAAYPDGTLNDEVMNNSAIKAITEEQLTRSISGLASLFLKGMENHIAPYVESTTTQKVIVDNSHGNDYEEDGELKILISYLSGVGFEVIEEVDGISAEDLANTDFLIVTAFGTAYSTAELTAISDWIDSGSKSIFVTGRGDFTPEIDHSNINSLLSTIGTVIRMNDDNIYTVGSDPKYWEDWYIYTENFQAPEGKEFLDVAQIYNLFSPNSLYFTEESDDLQILVNGTSYLYQSNEEAPAIHTIYDDSNDGVGGEVIPLVAAESLNGDDDRIIVFGDTSFSDYSFAQSSHHDNEHFIPTLIEWVSFDNILGGYSYLPTIIVESSGLQNKTFTIDYSTSDNVKMVKLFVDGTETTSDLTKPFDKLEAILNPGTSNVTLVAYNFDDQPVSVSFQVDVTNGLTTNTTDWGILSFIVSAMFLGLFRKRKK